MIDVILRLVLFLMLISMMTAFTFAILAVGDPDEDGLEEEFFGEEQE